MSEGKPSASEQYRCWTYQSNTYCEPKHDEWLLEVDRLKDELANARRTGQYWKDEHLIGNAEIDRLRAALTAIDARCLKHLNMTLDGFAWTLIAVTIFPLALWALARARRNLDERDARIEKLIAMMPPEKHK
jgi:hypothetical protein